MKKIFLLIIFFLIQSTAIIAREKIDESEILLQLDRDFNKATAEKGIEGWVAYFAPNGSMLSDTTMPTTGPDEIRKAMSPAFSNPTFSLRWVPTKAEILIPGELGYTIGKWVRTWKNKKDKIMKAVGTYTTIWKKQPDGLWKIVFDTGSSDGAPEEIK